MDFERLFGVAAATAVVAWTGFLVTLYVTRSSALLRRLSWGIAVAASLTVPVVIVSVTSIRSEARTTPRQPVMEAAPAPQTVEEPAPATLAPHVTDDCGSPAPTAPTVEQPAPPPATATTGDSGPPPPARPLPAVAPEPALPPPGPVPVVAISSKIKVLWDFETEYVSRCVPWCPANAPWEWARAHTAAHKGRFGGVWNAQTRAAVVFDKQDWSGYTHLQFACRPMADARRIQVALISDNLKTPVLDEYRSDVNVDWQGWKTVQVPLSSLSEFGQPLGRIWAVAFRIHWGPNTPKNGGQVYFDDIALVQMP